MEEANIRIKIEGYRAINSADIVLNGITVVAGENGSGKSTFSKLLYHVYNGLLNYDSLVSDNLKKNVNDVAALLQILIFEIRSISNVRNTKEEFAELEEFNRQPLEITEAGMEKWVFFIEKVINNYTSQPLMSKGLENTNNRRGERIRYIVSSILKNKSDDAIQIPFKDIVKYFRNTYNMSLEINKTRPNSLFLDGIASIYGDGAKPTTLEVYEFNDILASVNKNFVSLPFLIQDVIYIDTPLIFGTGTYNIETENLLGRLHKKGKSKYIKISNIISEVIGGKISVDENPISNTDFVYKRNDGKTYNLDECATGIKAFAILQLLIDNGSLTDKTLLIIDEPESNLHPQWIIEYARIIVMLNKEIGVKFFLATHNPDMVSAIRYIAKKEEVDTNLNFYLAEKKELDYVYGYTSLGTDIGPIFKSFNIALERINTYSSNQ